MSYNTAMKRLSVITVVLLVVAACAPVLRKDLMRGGIYDFQMSTIRETPERYQGKLFILGGVIAETRGTAEGSLIEAVFISVDSMGYLKDVDVAGGRFLAIYPKKKGILDPLIFRKGREITVAGEYVGNRTGMIDEMEYVYPLFEIRELYLWEEKRSYTIVPFPYPYLYYPRWYYDPWWQYSPWW
jgi:outer membrane lipoprotein